MIGVVYILRREYGFTPFQKFIDSYRTFSAGVEHKLIIILKGFHQCSSEKYLNYMSGMMFYHHYLQDTGFDLGTYGIVANMPPLEEYNIPDCDKLMCLNSFSEIRKDNWLKSFDDKLGINVGLVGGSHSHEAMGEKWYNKIFYPSFPNFHIRTNAFLMRKELMVKIWPTSFWTKWGCHMFESGRNSLTARVVSRGFRAISIGHTFRKGLQEDLIISDKQTKYFDNASTSERIHLRHLAWGTS